MAEEAGLLSLCWGILRACLNDSIFSEYWGQVDTTTSLGKGVRVKLALGSAKSLFEVPESHRVKGF